jgi:hypothetical protein
MQSFGAPGERFGMILVILRRARVEIPADVIEARRGDQRGHVGGRFLFEKMKPGHHVGNLHAGVVDVVLHFHAIARGAQHADEGVAQHRVAQMADVRGFVGIDVGVLDDVLPDRSAGSEQGRRRIQQGRGEARRDRSRMLI